jgi:hypothetical protein
VPLWDEAKALWKRHRRAWTSRVIRLFAGTEVKLEEGWRGLLRLVGDARSLLAKKHAALVDLEEFARVDSLKLTAGSPATLAPLTKTRLLDGLNELDLEDVEVRAEGSKALAQARQLSRLRVLNLHRCYVEHDGVKLLAKAPIFENLRSLNLRRNMIWPDSVAALARSPYLRHLRKLVLSFHHLDQGAAALADAPWLAGLEELDLSETATLDSAVIALADSPRLSRLVRLDLGSNRLGPAAVTALANSPHLGGLRELELRHNNLGDEGAVELARCPLARQLSHLDLIRTGLTTAGLRALLAARRGGDEFRELELTANDLGDDGAVALAEATARAPIQQLRAVGCGIGDRGARALGAALEADHILCVHLGYNERISPQVRNDLRRRFGGRAWFED